MKELWTPSRKLHLPPPALIGFWLEVGAWDAKGRVFHQERALSRSPLQQLLELLLAHMFFITVSITDTGGTPRDCQANTQSFNAKGTLNQDLHGIVIGTGNTPVDITDYQLVAQIMDGGGAGQMIYNAEGFDTSVTIADPDATFETWRNFNNNSGAGITVKETGIYCYADASGLVYLCLVRDVPTEIIVPDGGGCYVKYTAKITE